MEAYIYSNRMMQDNMRRANPRTPRFQAWQKDANPGVGNGGPITRRDDSWVSNI